MHFFDHYRTIVFFFKFFSLLQLEFLTATWISTDWGLLYFWDWARHQMQAAQILSQMEAPNGQGFYLIFRVWPCSRHTIAILYLVMCMLISMFKMDSLSSSALVPNKNTRLLEWKSSICLSKGTRIQYSENLLFCCFQKRTIIK